MSKANGREKDTTGISVDKQILSEVRSREDVNLSGLVNDLLSEYFESGSSSLAQLKAQRNRLQDRREQLESELESVEEELERIETQLEQQRERVSERNERIDELVESLGPSADISVENPAIQNWARKLSMTPAELVEEVEQRRSD